MENLVLDRPTATADNPPTLFMMVGIPYSGKSTFVKSMMPKLPTNTFIYSTDQIIENIAARYDQSYSIIFKKAYPLAELINDSKLAEKLSQRTSVVWDQTNLTIASRAKKLQLFNHQFKKIAYVFMPTLDQVRERMGNNNRRNKVVPLDVIESLLNSYQRPALEEGFDKIVDIT
jgi:predicted kinase